MSKESKLDKPELIKLLEQAERGRMRLRKKLGFSYIDEYGVRHEDTKERIKT